MNKKSRPTVGLALSGGAARGMAHVGVLSVLVNAGIPIDYVAGTSAGSLLGAIYSAGIPVPQIIDWAQKINWISIARPAVSREGLLHFRRLEHWLKFIIGDVRFCDLKTPFAAVTTDIETGKPVVLREGRVAEAVRASCSIPGIVEPAIINGQRLVDGGISDNIPIDVVRQMGAEYVIGVDLMEPYLPANAGPFGPYLMSQITMVQRSGGGPEEADCLIVPRLHPFRTLVDMRQRGEMIALGEEAAHGKLAEIFQELNMQNTNALAGLQTAPA